MSDEHFAVETIGLVEVDEGGFTLVIAEPWQPVVFGDARVVVSR